MSLPMIGKLPFDQRKNSQLLLLPRSHCHQWERFFSQSDATATAQDETDGGIFTLLQEHEDTELGYPLAQGDAYQRIALEIDKDNAALNELLKIVGESGINITPKVIISGNAGNGNGTNAETTALIGTMLDSMISDEPDESDQVASNTAGDG